MGCLWKFLADNSEIVVSISGLFVSLCALALTVYQAILARNHNKLSVKPSIATFLRTFSNQNLVYEASLVNAGLGPAFIKTYEILLDGNCIEASEPHEVHTAIKAAFPQYNFIDLECYYGLLRKKHVLAPNEKSLIAKIVISPTTASNVDELRRLQIRIVYESAYGEVQTYDSRHHSSS
jgi:hypothetical protein